MGGVSKTGSNFVVAFSLPKSQSPDVDGYVLVNAPSVREFSMSFPMNAMPSGHAVCMLSHNDIIPVGGSYGVMLIQDYGSDTTDDMELGIYISNFTQSQNTTDSVNISFDFRVGSKDADLKQVNFANIGTSVATMKECVKRAGMECTVRYSDNGRNSDTMVWRLVNGNFEENMDYIVSNSYIPSDILYWAFNESTGRIVISTFGTEKASKTRSLMLYSQDAMLSTKDAVYRPKSLAGTSVYRYQSMRREDRSSAWRASMFPNLVVDTTTSDGQKETGDCGGECLEVIMGTAGAAELPSGMKPPEDSSGVYGDPKLAMAFPMNGHKKYAVADTIRARLLSEYGRVAVVRIYNHFGPPVGSCVYLMANSMMIRQGDLTADPDYTARYIVMEKHVSQVTSTTAGTLGNTVGTMTSEYETMLVLATNFQYAKDPSKEYDIVMNVVSQVIDNVEDT
jgi:hypothetical protein